MQTEKQKITKIYYTIIIVTQIAHKDHKKNISEIVTKNHQRPLRDLKRIKHTKVAIQTYF